MKTTIPGTLLGLGILTLAFAACGQSVITAADKAGNRESENASNGERSTPPKSKTAATDVSLSGQWVKEHAQAMSANLASTHKAFETLATRLPARDPEVANALTVIASNLTSIQRRLAHLERISATPASSSGASDANARGPQNPQVAQENAELARVLNLLANRAEQDLEDQQKLDDVQREIGQRP